MNTASSTPGYGKALVNFEGSMGRKRQLKIDYKNAFKALFESTLARGWHEGKNRDGEDSGGINEKQSKKQGYYPYMKLCSKLS